MTDADIARSERDLSTSAADRLRELKALHDQKLITDEEYEQKRRKILDGM